MRGEAGLGLVLKGEVRLLAAAAEGGRVCVCVCVCVCKWGRKVFPDVCVCKWGRKVFPGPLRKGECVCVCVCV